MLANHAVALGGRTWRFNGTRISEERMLGYIRQASRLNPVPPLIVDFSRIATSAERQRLKTEISRVMGCDAESPTWCIEGTRQEHSSRQ